ncbi:MAG: ferric reductase-like transmembrane domain-containing protein [Candidatus Methanofastidiosa archaeon]|nr:ferric reductase-like transmembrane domain-containing protein [Candidatus Methanofastidiosa archaeon]
MLIFLITIALFLREYEYQGYVLRLIAKSSAFLAISSLSITYVISSRLGAIEEMFGGLDRAYVSHQIVGRASLILMIVHPLLLSASYGWNRYTLKIFFLPGYSIDHTLGLLSLIIVFVLVTLTICFNYRYDVWLYTHRVMIIALPLAALHSLRIGSEAQNASLYYWIIFLSMAGMIGYAYKVFLYKRFGPRNTYAIEGLALRSNVTEIVVGPTGKSKKVTPGQFFFLQFPELGGELHPFSVSRIYDDLRLRFSIKASGDYTSREVPTLRNGSRAILYGPYGRFLQDLKRAKGALLVAGGIGITPFLSILNSAEDGGQNIRLLWSISGIEDAIYEEELEEIEGKIGNFQHEIWISGINGRVKAADIIELFEIQEILSDIEIFLCGPQDMIYDLSSELASAGAQPKNIFLEEFKLR